MLLLSFIACNSILFITYDIIIQYYFLVQKNGMKLLKIHVFKK